MSDSTETNTVAVRVPADPAKKAGIDSFLRSRGITGARRFAAKDDDELNDAVCREGARRVIFLDLGQILDAIWIGHVQYDRWLELGAVIELVEPPPEGNGWRQFLQVMAISLADYRRRRRLRQILAAAVLSLLALGAIWLLLVFR